MLERRIIPAGGAAVKCRWAPQAVRVRCPNAAGAGAGELCPPRAAGPVSNPPAGFDGPDGASGFPQPRGAWACC